MSFVQTLVFDRDSEDFVLGAEVGGIFEQLQYEHGEVEAIMHVQNAEMALRMAEASARSVQSEELGDGWIYVVFGAPATESGFRRGDLVEVFNEAARVVDPTRTPRGTIRVHFEKEWRTLDVALGAVTRIREDADA